MKKQKINSTSVFLHFTGSMFGVGCSAFNKQAIARVTDLKKRESGKGIIVLIAERESLQKYGILISQNMQRLLEQYWPGELTVILPDPKHKFEYVSVQGEVAFRLPKDPFLRTFIKEFKYPIISTSINLSGESPVGDLTEVRKTFSSWFDVEVLPEKIIKVENKPSTIISIKQGKLNLIRAGNIPFSELEISYNMPQILFVCTGNTCRSPMAELIAEEIIRADDLRFRTASAGFLLEGIPISANSGQVLAENGIESGNFRSSLLSDNIIRQSWRIFTMTIEHKRKLIESFPEAASKVYTIAEYTGKKGDIADPIGRDIGFYTDIFKELDRKIKIIFDLIREER